MSKPVIEVKGISKKYQINHEQKAQVGTATFRDAITNTLKKPLELFTGHIMEKEEFWALQDISFEVSQGDVLGIIGRNGSGKSTLLKILSRIVEPTRGEAIMRGRVASLLEVGTGFHPELTGRENIYFNGAILGMRRKEIESKFDEIVAFSEVEKFLDTPVKFYSSGMYVRLAFAVAAHLEPDILIIDEVLAVGDANFQKKCLGKMNSVAREGRTVIFVSHSMDSVRNLCTRALLLDKGHIKMVGTTDKIISSYYENIGSTAQSEYVFTEEKSKINRINSLQITDGVKKRSSAQVQLGKSWGIEVSYSIGEYSENTICSLEILSQENNVIYFGSDADTGTKMPNKKSGKYKTSMSFNGGLLMPGQYSIRIALQQPGKKIFDIVENIPIEILPSSKDQRDKYFGGGHYIGVINQVVKWDTKAD